jgi:hypothetical protein
MFDLLREGLRDWLGIEDQRCMLLQIFTEQEQLNVDVDKLASKIGDLVKNKASARQLGRNDEKVMKALEKVRKTQAEIQGKMQAGKPAGSVGWDGWAE